MLVALDAEFTKLYGDSGRPSIAPERLLRALLLQVFYTIRSERQLMERLEFDLLFRWFVGIGVDDAVWDHSTFSKNRERLLEGDIAAKLLSAVLAQPRVKQLLSTDHFSVDGTLIEAWASMKSFKPKDGDEPLGPGGGRNGEADFHGQKRSNDTHASTTDPEARLYRKGPGKEAKLCFMGHALMENCNGLLVDACVTWADGHAERIAALHMDRTAGPIGRKRSRWAPTRPTTPRILLTNCGRSTQRRTWRRTPTAARRRSTAGPRDTPDTPSASGSANGSRKPSAG